ncbi:hypothetical protein RJ641_032845 [Dillenia turbinata]|uniref:Uncharacterized protein n=1 Tax=Dillenia turbinata TaxID=194707 RepID=A0AAN8VKF3_9MAGN
MLGTTPRSLGRDAAGAWKCMSGGGVKIKPAGDTYSRKTHSERIKKLLDDAAMAQRGSFRLSSSDSPRTPKSPLPTVEQLLRGEASRSYASSSPTALKGGHDLEEYHIHQNRRSVLTKVREKAKRWRQNLANKKNNNSGDNPTPSWGVSLEDDDEEDDKDPEYLGAPMYESELAPEGLKESARQHPRANPVISESHTFPSVVKTHEDQPKQNSPGAGKTVNEKVTETLAPAYKSVSEAPNNITTKLQGMTMTSSSAPGRAGKTVNETITETLAPAYKSVSEAPNNITTKLQGMTVTSSSAPGPREFAPRGEQVAFDKGVSVKEYLRHKFEPGDEEKALSHVITEAISPRKAPGDVGYIEKVREAVTSFLRPEVASLSTISSEATKSYQLPTTSTTTINFYEGN